MEVESHNRIRLQQTRHLLMLSAAWARQFELFTSGLTSQHGVGHRCDSCGLKNKVNKQTPCVQDIINEVCSAQAKIKNHSTSKIHFFETVQRPQRTDPVDDSVPLQRQRLVGGRPPRERRDSVRPLLAEPKHAKFLLKTYQQVAYKTVPARADAKKRELLAALTVGGQAEQYLERSVAADQVEIMTDEEVEQLYARYEARLGAAMTNTLKTATLQFYTGQYLKMSDETTTTLERQARRLRPSKRAG
ncbi:hypothetical protein LSAT2_003589 [Lamellibrachia satsuma]|nr:hypothetical protein LSAT2_003589 [Lamellibrachia satsuma]